MKSFRSMLVILLILTITLVFGINHIFYEPTKINSFIAAKIYKAPANSYFG